MGICKPNRNFFPCGSSQTWGLWHSMKMRQTAPDLETSGVHQETDSTGQTWTCWSGARGGHSNDPRAGTPLL